MTKEQRKRRDDQILFDCISGVSPEALTKTHGFSAKYIYEILRSQGIQNKRTLAEKDRRVLDLHREGKSRAAIATELAITRGSVRYTLTKNGFTWIPEEVTCEVCGTIHMQKVKGQHLCSPECRKSYNKELALVRLKSDIGLWKNCEFCGKPYKTNGSDMQRRKFCSRSCSLARSSARKTKKNELRDQEIFYLRHVQELTFRRIGEIFGIHLTTARKRYNQQKRIRAALLDKLEGD